MKKWGIILMLAGISLIATLSVKVANRDRSMLAIHNGIESNEIVFIRWFTAIGTVLVIAGVSATVLDKRI